MQPKDTTRWGQPDDPDSVGERGPDDEPEDEAVSFGIGIALDRQTGCPHGFDRPYCPFGCA